MQSRRQTVYMSHLILIYTVYPDIFHGLYSSVERINTKARPIAYTLQTSGYFIAHTTHR